MSDWSSDVGSSALLAAVLSRRVAEVPFGGDGPIRPKAVFAQWLVGEARADALFRHDDDRLPQTLVRQLVERDEHERPAFAGRRGRFDKQILLAALLVGAFLHGAHPKGVGLGRCATLCGGNGDRKSTT